MKWVTEIIILCLILFYSFLTGVSINLFFIWVYLPLIFTLAWSFDFTIREQSKSFGFWGFLAGVNLFMLPVHISWYFDIGSFKTGSSTSGLIFAVMPIWAFICGVLAGSISHVVIKARK